MEEDSSKDKKPKKSLKFLWIIPAVILGFILLVVLIDSTNNTPSGQTTKSTCKDVQVPYEEQEEYAKTEYYTETVPYTDRECENKEIPYSIDNFVLNYNNCNEKKKDCKTGFMGIPYDCIEYCIDRSMSCSLDLRNLDNEASGTWTIRFNFYERSTNNLIKANDVSDYLYPQTTKKFTGITNIKSSGVNGDANKQLTCFYDKVNIPTKQVCRDVTKYKEVQRERQVTAYRPVTKYKTEQKCD